MKKARKPKSKKVTVLTTVVSILLFAIVLVCVGSLLYTKYILKQPASLFGLRIVKIITDSMSPTINEGEYILVTAQPGMDAEVGDILLHIPEEGACKGLPMTHQCVKAPYYDEERAGWYILTQGVKHGAPVDPPVPVENVQAVYIATLSGMGGFLDFVTSVWGLIILIAIPCVIGILIQVFNIARAIKKAPDAAAVAAESERIKATRNQQLADEAIAEFQERQKILAYIAARKSSSSTHSATAESTNAQTDSDTVSDSNTDIDSTPADTASTGSVEE